MDDVLVFDQRKDRLWETLREVRLFAGARLGLCIKDAVTRVAPTRDGVPFLGARVYPSMVRLDGAGARRLARSLRQVEALHGAGRLGAQQCSRRLTSLVAHAWQLSTRSFLRQVAADLAGPPSHLP